MSEPRGGVLPAQRSGKASQLLGHSAMDRRQWDSLHLPGSTGGSGQPQLTRQPGLEGCIYQLKRSKWWFLHSGPGRDLWGMVPRDWEGLLFKNG